jgi:ABC-type polysaccharide/polyol phosphate transport system ATPase subunit
MALVEFEHVSKAFARTGGARLLRAYLRDCLHRRQPEPFYALSDVSFSLEHGQSLAVIGRNGAGKSTLLSLVANLCRPTAGSVTVRGRVAALLELGSGFHPDLTGAENVRLNAAFLGLTRGRTEKMFDSIVEFSEMGPFLRDPIRTWSSGMIMRLAFSVAIHGDPDILMIDEVLAVGDQRFQAKCLDRIMKFWEQGKTLLFVSHSPELVRRLCDKAIWLDKGHLVMSGSAGTVLDAYAADSVSEPGGQRPRTP